MLAHPPEPASQGASILCVDDDSLVAGLLEECIRSSPNRWLGAAHTLSQALVLCRSLRPSILLLSTDLPDADGLAAAAELQKSLPAPRVIVMPRRLSEGLVLRIRQAPIHGVVLKSPDFRQDVLEALASVDGRTIWYTRRFRDQARELERHPEALVKILSNKEFLLLRELGLGRSDQDIAITHGLSRHTVHAHRSNIMRKLRLNTNRDLMAFALAKGFVSASDFRS